MYRARTIDLGPFGGDGGGGGYGYGGGGGGGGGGGELGEISGCFVAARIRHRRRREIPNVIGPYDKYCTMKTATKNYGRSARDV